MRPITLGLVLRTSWLVAGFGILVSPTAGAQGSWTVTLTPPSVPQPIGSCGAVWLKVFDSKTRSTARNPAGALVSMADFDMTVSTPDGKSVVGQYIDASHWSVCSCQAAAVGAVGTITASYPGQLLTDRTRVPDLKFETTATFVVGKTTGAWNPPGCAAPLPTAVIAVAPIAVVPTAPMTSTTPTPTAAPAPVAVPDQTVRVAPVPPPPPGPPPRGLTIGGNPVEAEVFWAPPDGTLQPTSYIVERWKTADPACCRATSPTLPPKYSNSWSEVMMWTGPWTYQVTANYANGSRGSTMGSYTYPEPETPKGLTARQTARNTVVFAWQPVQNAAYYVVSGPPSNTAIKVSTTSITRTDVPVGSTNWQVAAMYVGKTSGSPPQTSPFATTSLAVVNPHYRLVAEAVRVTTETVDMQLSEDGMYDEIFVAGLAEIWDPQTGTLKIEAARRSHVHGDVTYWLPGLRVKAGTASAEGGIRAGDLVSPIWAAPSGSMLAGEPPFVLWDGELLPGRHELLLHPTIWEVDQPESAQSRDISGEWCGALCAWKNFLSKLGSRAGGLSQVKAAMVGSQIGVVEGDRVWLTGHGEMVHLENHDKDRPIGLERSDNTPGLMGLTGWMRDRVVVLSSEKIEAALASGKNTIEVRFWDHWTIANTPPTTINYLNGDYTMVIRIERMP